jgi:hypothetical protein
MVLLDERPRDLDVLSVECLEGVRSARYFSEQSTLGSLPDACSQ